MFRLFSDMEEKETATNEKLIRALERCDELDLEVEKLKRELSEFHELDHDL
jgi:hypothetical protein